MVRFAVNAALGFSGFFSEHTPSIFLFALTPIAAFVAAFAVSHSLRAWAFALDKRARLLSGWLTEQNPVRTGATSSPARTEQACWMLSPSGATHGPGPRTAQLTKRPVARILPVR